MDFLILQKSSDALGADQKHEQKQEVNQSKDDADLRQLVDFMKKVSHTKIGKNAI